MTRSEWIAELKRYISILPQKEQNKAIEYYTEIFDDKFDSGMSEKDIIAGFGEPYEAANDIIKVYQEDNPDWQRPAYDTSTGDAAAQTFQKKEPTAAAKETHSGGTGGTLLAILFGIILYPIAFSLALSLLCASFACILGGVVGIITSIASAEYALIGVCHIFIGIGLAIIYPIIYGSKWMFYGIYQLLHIVKTQFAEGL